MSHTKVGKNAEYANRSIIRQGNSKIPDTLRDVLGKYYIPDTGGIEYGGRVPTDFESEVKDEETINVKLTEQAPLDRLLDLASVVNTTEVFSDYHYKKVLPIDRDELEKINKVGTVDFSDVNSFYSFYAKEYESVIAGNPSIPENILPSFYSIYAESVYDQKTARPLNTLANNFKSNLREGFLTVFDEEDESVKSRFSKYFEDYARSISDMILTKSNFLETFKNLSDGYNTYVFTESSTPLFTTEAVKAEGFPMYNKISFSTDKNTAFSNILQELKVERELAREIVGTPPDQTLSFGCSSEAYTPSDFGPPIESLEYSNISSKVWDVKEWITDKLFNSLPAGVEIGESKKEKTGADLSIQKLFTKMILSTKLNKLSKDELRTLEDMMSGKPSYSEAVMYKVEKFDYSNGKANSVPLTTYYIPNSSKLDVCNFVDTQVKYGKKYKYTISSFDLVIGSEYSYPNAYPGKNTNSIDVKVDYKPSMKIVESRLTDIEDVVVVDNPPMPPEVSFVPYRDINNMVLININSSTGDRVLKPVVVEPSDSETFQLARDSQRRIDDKIRFKSDDASAIFEVYRTTEKPKSYQDFGGKRHTDLSTGESSTAASIKDRIEPNTDYYYSFRIRDVHGNVSNPSMIYRIRMEDLEDGPHFLDVDVVDLQELQEDEGKQVSKAMRRYVQIIPTVSQGLLNVKDSDLLDVTTVNGVTSVVLGVADEALWDKRFKIRFTSEKTGRKVDLDVKFVVRHKLKQT